MSSLVLAGALACLALSGSADHKPGHGGGGGGGGSIVKATFRDAGFNILTVAQDRIASDCQLGDLDATSCPYVHGQASVSAGFSNNGNFILEVNKGTRDVYFNFTDCVTAPCPPDEPRFLSSGDVDAFVGTQSGTRARLLVVNLGSLAVGQSAALNAEFLLSKHIDRVDGEEEVWWVTYRSNAPEVCLAGSSGPLMGTRVDANTWVVEAGATNVACLHSFAARPQGDGSEEFHGAYLMPFKLTITTQP
jgi:hypothetical protein